MGTGQMLLTIGAIILLGNMILTSNRGINNIQKTMLKTGYDINAISLARSTIERAQELAFDENTQDSTWVNALSGLTPAANLGQESSIGDTLDDYDDFNGPPRVGSRYRIGYDTLQTGLIYKDSSTVQYVSRKLSDGTFIYSGSPTWTKRLDIWVWLYKIDTKAITPLYSKMDSAGVDTVHMINFFSYWY